MRDIVLRKTSRGSVVGVSHPNTVFQPIQNIPASRRGWKGFLRSGIEWILNLGEKIGKSLSRVVFDSQPPKVVQFSNFSNSYPLPEIKPGAPQPPVAKPAVKELSQPRVGKRKRLTKEATKAAVKHGYTKVRNHVNRASAVQLAIFLALFGYGFSQRNQVKVFQPRSAGDSVEKSLQMFLPSAKEYTPPKEFQSISATQNEDTKVPLHAWLTPWNLDQIKNNQDKYRSISAFWLTIQADGFSTLPKSDWKDWQVFKSNKPAGQRFFVTISGNPEYAAAMLADPILQEKHIDELLQITESKGFDGVDIDYEGLGVQNRSLFTDFIRNLSTRFHSQQKLVSVTLEARLANDVPMDWFALGKTADELRIMAYDYHAKTTNFPGPIAPLGWIKEILDYAQTMIPADKLIIGLGNYGYDWTQTEGENAWEGVGVSFDQAVALAKEKGLEVLHQTGIDDRGYDIGSTPTFVYKDEQGKQHSVWFEDSASLQTKVNLVSQYKTAGIIFWTVGLGDQTFWQNNNLK